MMKRIALTLVVAGILIAIGTPISAAQETTEQAKTPKATAWTFYKLDFNVREMDGGKTLNTRSYTLNMKNGGSGSQIRVGTRIPYTGEKGPSYMDVGFNVDCRLDDQQALEVRTDLSSLPTDQSQEKGAMPLIRNLRTSSVIPITLNKPILVASVDELGSTHRMQVEVTITQLK